MRFNLCNVCGFKISRVSANGVVIYTHEMRQIAAIYDRLDRPIFADVPSNSPNYGKIIGYKQQQLHIPVCMKCAADVGNINYEKMKLMLKSDPTFRKLTQTKTKPVKLVGFKLDVQVFAGQVIRKVDPEENEEEEEVLNG